MFVRNQVEKHWGGGEYRQEYRVQTSTHRYVYILRQIDQKREREGEREKQCFVFAPCLIPDFPWWQ